MMNQVQISDESQQSKMLEENKKLIEEINTLKTAISQKDVALNQWMRMCEDLSQSLLQKQIDLKQLEISRNIGEEHDNDIVKSDDEHILQSAEYNHQCSSFSDQKNQIKTDGSAQLLFYQNENIPKVFSISNENGDIEDTNNNNNNNSSSRCTYEKSTAIGSFQTLHTHHHHNNRENNTDQKESKGVDESFLKRLQLSDNNREQLKLTNQKKNDDPFYSNYINQIQSIKQIEQGDIQELHLLDEFRNQIGFEHEFNHSIDKNQIDNVYEGDILSENIQLKQCLEEIKQEKDALALQNNQFFLVINEKCLEIQHLQSLLIQRDKSVIDHYEQRNEEYKQFLKANNGLVTENIEQREMIFRFKQQLALLNYLKAENQQVNLLKQEKQNLLLEQEKAQQVIKNLNILIQEQSGYKLQYNELKTDYEILANHIQCLGDEYITNSIQQSQCPTCYSQDQYRLIITQLQQKINHLEKQYKYDVTNLLEDINVLNLDINKKKDN